MAEYEGSVSPKGQITLPIEVRKRLGIKAKDKVAIQLEDGLVTVRPVRSALGAIYQSVPPLRRSMSIEDMTEIAADEHAKHAAGEGLPSRP